MKIIDILNKIANGEEPPKKIIYDSKLWEYDNQNKDYFTNHYDGTEWLFDEYVITDILNDEVEILEITITIKPDKIEKLEYINVCQHNADGISVSLDIEKIIDKINEIIEVLNER